VSKPSAKELKAHQEKQQKIADLLLAQAQEKLDELGIEYALVLHGMDRILTNTKTAFALTLLRDSLELHDKIASEIVTAKAESAADAAGYQRGKDES
jgi:hypothetical protein